MSKSVLISINPKYCELIASGAKTIEIRKTRPKMETPFKCYIYETKNKDYYAVYHETTIGKVVGEFVCNEIMKCETVFYTENRHPIYEALLEWNEDNEIWEPLASNCDEYQTWFLRSTGLNLEDFRKYLGNGENRFYGWHISDLKIYDKPRELREFRYYNCNFVGSCFECEKSGYASDMMIDCFNLVKNPPQSWCYVEEVEE